LCAAELLSIFQLNNQQLNLQIAKTKTADLDISIISNIECC